MNEVKKILIFLFSSYRECELFFNKHKIQIPKQFNDTKDELLHIIDDNQNFIDNFIEITNEDKDRISKTDLFECYKSVYPNKYITER